MLRVHPRGSPIVDLEIPKSKPISNLKSNHPALLVRHPVRSRYQRNSHPAATAKVVAISSAASSGRYGFDKNGTRC